MQTMTAVEGDTQSIAVPPEIEISEVSMRYTTVSGDAVLALDRVSLAVRPKEFVCVVGTSGCGKTTLLRIVAGLVRHTTGRVSLRVKWSNTMDVAMAFERNRPSESVSLV